MRMGLFWPHKNIFADWRWTALVGAPELAPLTALVIHLVGIAPKVPGQNINFDEDAESSEPEQDADGSDHDVP